MPELTLKANRVGQRNPAQLQSEVKTATSPVQTQLKANQMAPTAENIVLQFSPTKTYGGN